MPLHKRCVGAVVGDAVGADVGEADGAAVGDTDGDAVGDAVGAAVGDAVGDAVGARVGVAVGDAVGVAVGDSVQAPHVPGQTALMVTMPNPDWISRPQYSEGVACTSGHTKCVSGIPAQP